MQSDKHTAMHYLPEPETAPEATMGKIIHNEITYRGVDWLLNSTLGVATTYWAARTESGQKYFQKPVINFFSRALEPILKTPEKVAEGARWGSMFTSIIVGGMLIIPPMVMLEKKENKKKIIKGLDSWIYGKDKVESDPRFQQAYDAIDHETPKDFSTGMAARFAVLAPMIYASVTPDINKHMVKYLYKPIARGTKAAAESIGIKPQKLIERGVVEVAEGDISHTPKFVSDWDFIHTAMGFDFGLTAIYSYAHEYAYKGISALRYGSTPAADVKEESQKPNPHGFIASAPSKAAEPSTIIQPHEIHGMRQMEHAL